jgi:acyl-CoA dehydrogenase
MAGTASAQGPCEASTLELGALLRVAQSAGALDAALRLAMDYTGQRVQFGKTLSQQQAVQQSLAILAVEAAAVDVAGQAAANALDGGDAGWEIAAAKLRTNIAIGTGTGIAHQVHGAIGFTRDYDLHRYTLRLMAWRSQFGNDRQWAAALGDKALKAGGAGLWAEFTWRGDAQIGRIGA